MFGRIDISELVNECREHADWDRFCKENRINKEDVDLVLNELVKAARPLDEQTVIMTWLSEDIENAEMYCNEVLNSSLEDEIGMTIDDLSRDWSEYQEEESDRMEHMEDLFD